MHSVVSRVILACCPQTSFLFPSRTRTDYASCEEEYERYEPRPQIVINPETASLKSCVSDRQLNGLLLGSSGTTLIVSAQYSPQKTTAIVKITSLHGYSSETICSDEELSVRVVIEGSKNPKQMTSYLEPNKTIRFKETFSFPGLDEATLRDTGIKFRVYSRKGKSRGSLRGEGHLDGKNVSSDGPQQAVITINPINTLKSEPTTGLSPSMHRMSNGSFVNGDSRRSSMVDACGRFCSQPNAESPELLLALCYDQDQNAITVTIEKGSQIGDKQKPPDTFVKISATVEFGTEFWRCKTDVVKGTSEPQYDFSGSVQLPKGQGVIDNTTVKIEVWQTVGMLRRRYLLGTVCVGLNSSNPDAQEHWEQMIKAHGIAISKWHTLNGNDA